MTHQSINKHQKKGKNTEVWGYFKHVFMEICKTFSSLLQCLILKMYLEEANKVAQRVSEPFTLAVHSLILQLLTSHQSPLLFLNNVSTREWVACDRPIP